ncbi:MAG: bifunctional diguanylate cyclase/phosphodiesterase [Plesiomonas sp.]|uniref:bifunctional diguanylate cyclase/phosphodiesterase n=1 Tax=Plesiomonas sp. TaxID=2486279 RepID=UPI003F3EC46F
MKLSGSLSLRLVITLLFFIAISAILGVSMLVQYRNASEMVKELSEKIASTRAQLVSDDLDNYLKAPLQANTVIAMSIHATDNIDTHNLISFSPTLYNTIHDLFPNTPQLSFVAIGTHNGNYVGISREMVKNKYALTLKDSNTDNELRFFTDLSIQSPILSQFKGYDPRTRPWYRESAAKKISLWSNAYYDYHTHHGITISYSTPAYDKNNQFIGIVTSDIKLNRFNQYLKTTATNDHSIVLILNKNNQIISHSTDEKIEQQNAIIDLSSMENPNLLTPNTSADSRVRAAATFIDQNKSGSYTFKIKGETYFLRMMGVGQAIQLDNWKVVVIVPESEVIGGLYGDREEMLLWIIAIFASGVTLTWFALSKITTPIMNVAKTARLLTQQKWQPVKHDRFELKEIRRLNDAFNDMSSSLSNAFNQQQHLIEHDQNTGLLNKAGLKQWLKTHLSSEENRLQGLLLLSINNIDAIKNSMGDESLNALYRVVAQKLLAFAKNISDRILVIKSSDNGFMLVYVDPNPTIDSSLQCYLALFTESLQIYNDDVLITTNIGCVLEPFGVIDLANAYIQANIARLAAKKKGENTGVIYDKTLADNVGLSTQILTHLNSALENNELYLHYQPIVDLKSGLTVGAEVLLRWQSASLGVVSPDQFIPIAEQSGLILPIGSWTLMHACKAIADKIKYQQWPTDFELHINISVRQIIQTDFIAVVKKALIHSQLNPANLTLELTESMLIENFHFIEERLHILRNIGVKIALDDFGSGYSSLAHLHQLTFDCLKIDRTFVSGLLNSAGSDRIINSVIQLANSCHVPLVAEGVENAEEASRLKQLGAKKAQGYYFGRPIPLEEWKLNL